jgi:thioredoxin 1
MLIENVRLRFYLIGVCLTVLSGASSALAQASSMDPAQEPLPLTPTSPDFLYPGQSMASVKKMLGNPSGEMSAPPRRVLLYNNLYLQFENDQLVDPIPDLPDSASLQKPPTKKEMEEEPLTAKLKREGAQFWNQITAKVKASPLAAKKEDAKTYVVQGPDGKPVNHKSLLFAGKVTVVDFYATWCAPCKQISPILNKIIYSEKDVALRKVNIGDWGSETTKRYNVNSVPNIRVFDKHGTLVGAPTSNPNEVRRLIKLAQSRE